MATQTTIWDELGDLVVSDEGKRELAALRSTYADISGKLSAMAKVGSPGTAPRAWVGAAAAHAPPLLPVAAPALGPDLCCRAAAAAGPAGH